MSTRPSWYLTETLTQIKRRRAGAVDDRGNDVFTVTQVQLPNCRYDPRSVTSVMYAAKMENIDREEHVTGFGVLFVADPHADIEPTDSFLIEGLEYEVLGPIERHTGTRFGNDHAETPLRRVTG